MPPLVPLLGPTKWLLCQCLGGGELALLGYLGGQVSGSPLPPHTHQHTHTHTQIRSPGESPQTLGSAFSSAGCGLRGMGQTAPPSHLLPPFGTSPFLGGGGGWMWGQLAFPQLPLSLPSWLRQQPLGGEKTAAQLLPWASLLPRNPEGRGRAQGADPSLAPLLAWFCSS